MPVDGLVASGGGTNAIIVARCLLKMRGIGILHVDCEERMGPLYENPDMSK